MLYRRFVQARITNTQRLFNEAWTVETAADAAKPVQSNSGVPEFHAGMRLASTRYKSASSAGAGSSMIPLSVAVSGAIIPVRTSNGSGNGGAVAFDASLPLIPSTDGKDKSNTLTWMGEVLNGAGVGGSEVAGLTSGVGAVPGSFVGLGAGTNAVDSGVAGVNTSGSVELIKYRMWRTHLQYTVPGGKWAMSAGYSQIEGRNLDRFAVTGTAAQTAIAPKEQYEFFTVMYDPMSWLRLAMDINQTRNVYNDNANRYAQNNRVQFTTFFIF